MKEEVFKLLEKIRKGHSHHIPKEMVSNQHKLKVGNNYFCSILTNLWTLHATRNMPDGLRDEFEKLSKEYSSMDFFQRKHTKADMRRIESFVKKVERFSDRKLRWK